MLVFCFWLKLHVQIGLEDLVFVERVDPDVGDAARAERFIRAAAVAVTEVETNGVAERVSSLDDDALDVHPAIEEVGINQIRVECVLLGVLPESLELHVLLRLQLTDAGADLIRVTLISGFRMSRGARPIIRIEIDGEIAEDAERDFADLEPEFRRHFQNEQAVDPNLVRGHRSGVTEAPLTADVEAVKAVAVAAVVIEDRRDLEINVLREIELRADLPREEPGVGVRHQPAAGHSPGTERVLRI